MAAWVFALMTLPGCYLSHQSEVPEAYEWVPPDRYCDRTVALGCSSLCAEETLCRRDLADECFRELEETFDSCETVPTILSEDPICSGICVPEGETYQPEARP